MEQKSGKTAVMFPGQGSQEKGMGRDIAESWPEAMQIWEDAEKAAGADLREIFWQGDAQAMQETRYLQPALFAVGLCIWQILGPSLRPGFAAGHSVGEFTALAASGVLEYKDCMQLVALRGRLMSEAGQKQEGGMLAVLRLEQETLQQIVERAGQDSGGVLCIANYNSPQQLVLSGSNAALQAAKELIKAQKGKAIALPVSGAFHSSLMQEAAQELAAYMQRLHWYSPQINLHLNLSAKVDNDPQAIAQAMQKQMISPVLWLQLVQEQWAQGVRNWFELGPRDVLSKLLKYCLQDKDEAWQATKVDSLQAVQEMLGRD
ncbi:MAG: ACP S-malonyltransferase [Thermodesulfobacteriota bacterium]